MSFGAPQWFWGLLLVPALIALFIRGQRRGAKRLREFVSPRLLPQLAASIDRPRRLMRFALQLLGLGLVLISLAQPRWGYTIQDVKRKGIDVLLSVDTSRSMLANDVQPNRLERVKLATQDLVNQLEGDRVGLIAFAGLAFVQAPLTIDYQAVIEAINDLDTKIIPEGGTNISGAIDLARRTYGKSAIGNRALVIFTDGEELSGDAVKAAKTAAEAGVRIFTVGVGTPQGSLIPIRDEGGETSFVKDFNGQVVKSKLDENRLRQIARETGGFYLHLENGPRTMEQLFKDGLSKMSARDIDARVSRPPIERYQWPLGAALLVLAGSMLLNERKRLRIQSARSVPSKAIMATAAAAFLIACPRPAFAIAPGLDLYREGKYAEAYRAFQEDLKSYPESAAKERMQFDAGTAAYQMRDYDKATEAFSQALLTKDKGLQENSHFNMGRTLEERADMAKTDEHALKDLYNAKTHYEDVLKLDPNNEAAKANLEEVKKKIERLKNHRKQQQQKPPPPPPPKKNQKGENGESGGGQNNQQQSQNQNQNQNQSGSGQNQQQQQQQQQKQQQQSQNQNQSGSGQNQKPDQSQSKNESRPNSANKPGESPSPSPQQSQPNSGTNQQQKSSSGNQGTEPSPSPSPEQNQNQTPSPSPGNGEGSGEGQSPTPVPGESPQKKFAGEIKGAATDQSPNPNQPPQNAVGEPEKEGEMTAAQAQALVQSMKDEEARVQLDERKAARHVYKDW